MEKRGGVRQAEVENLHAKYGEWRSFFRGFVARPDLTGWAPGVRRVDSMRSALLSLCLLVSALPAFSAAPRLNEIQAIGSHNSYHVAPPRELVEIIVKTHKGAAAWNYTHPSLTEQLGMGVRQFELDIFADPEGGLFADPLALKLAKLAGAEDVPFDAASFRKPGYKVLHVPDIDFGTTVPLLAGALGEMKAWSDKNPRHLPVMILLECKDKPQPPLPAKPEPLTRERLLELEKEILAAIPPERLLKPDDVRGGEKTLRDAVQKRGWPELEKSRGKFILCLDNTDEIRDRYLEGNPALEGRLIFASAPDAEHPAAGWFKCNDPIREQEKIRGLVKAGFLVRTRADTNKPDARMKAAAFGSGAQWVSTDHFRPDSPVRVAFKGGKTVRANPVSSGETGEIAP